MTRQLRRIRWAVRATLALGIAASVAANVLHAETNPIAQTIAAWPPIALLITLELAARLPVRRGLAWLRFVGVSVIAGIAAWVSYWHMAGVAARYGEDPVAAHLLPISVDGLIVVASVSLVEIAARIRADTLPPQPDPEREVDPLPASETEPLAGPAETGLQSVADEQAAPDRRIDAPKARVAAALTRLAEGTDIEQCAAEAGMSVRQFQQRADELAAATRRPRGGRRKPLTDLSPPAGAPGESYVMQIADAPNGHKTTDREETNP